MSFVCFFSVSLAVCINKWDVCYWLRCYGIANHGAISCFLRMHTPNWLSFGLIEVWLVKHD